MSRQGSIFYDAQEALSALTINEDKLVLLNSFFLFHKNVFCRFTVRFRLIKLW